MIRESSYAYDRVTACVKLSFQFDTNMTPKVGGYKESQAAFIMQK